MKQIEMEHCMPKARHFTQSSLCLCVNKNYKQAEQLVDVMTRMFFHDKIYNHGDVCPSIFVSNSYKNDHDCIDRSDIPYTYIDSQ